MSSMKPFLSLAIRSCPKEVLAPFRSLLALGILALAACGDGGTEPGPPPQPNRPPVASGTIPAQTVAIGESVTVNVASAFSDPDGDALTYTAMSSTPGVAAVAVSGASVTITSVAVGTAVLTVTATDPEGLSASLNVQTTVFQPNRAPVALVSEAPALTAHPGDTVVVDVSPFFSDPDEDSLTYSAESSDTSVVTVLVSGPSVVVMAIAKGTTNVTVAASDPEGLSASLTIAVTVVNRSPVTQDSIPPQSLAPGQTAVLDVASFFSDPDGDSLTYSAESSDTAVVTVLVSGPSVVVTAIAKGTTNVTVTASDPEGLSAQQMFQVTVNRAPVVTDRIPGQAVGAGDFVSLDLAGYFSEPDGDALTYEAESSAVDVARVSVSGTELTVTGVMAGGTATVAVTATDPEGSSATQSFEVAVVWRISGKGNGIFEIPTQVKEARIEGEYTGRGSNFIIWCGTYADRGGLLVNVILGTGRATTTYSDVHSMRRSYNNSGDPCGTVEIRHSEGVEWSITDVTGASGSSAAVVAASKGSAFPDLETVRQAVEARGPVSVSALTRYLETWVAAETLEADATRDPNEALEIRQRIEALRDEIAKLRNERGGGRSGNSR